MSATVTLLPFSRLERPRQLQIARLTEDEHRKLVRCAERAGVSVEEFAGWAVSDLLRKYDRAGRPKKSIPRTQEINVR